MFVAEAQGSALCCNGNMASWALEFMGGGRLVKGRVAQVLGGCLCEACAGYRSLGRAHS